MDFSIESFWRATFNGVGIQQNTMPIPGWLLALEHDSSYVQAGMSLREGYADLSSKIWLVGAPGAVGKSTLAKEICAATGAVYLDLASAATVAGNYLVGGLAYTGLLPAWNSGATAVVIDALDEARLRVTQSGFEAFLTDVAKISALGKFPVVIFGRVGIIEEAWTILDELSGVSAPIFEIALFNEEDARKFVFARLTKYARERDINGNLLHGHLGGALQTHESVYKDVVARVVESLRVLSAQDGNRFVGYAPVLDAVSKVIASEGNPSKIGEETLRVLERRVLSSLSNEILKREKGKLVSQVLNTIPQLPDGLYTPEEQLGWLASRLFGVKPPPLPLQLQQSQIANYEQAVNSLLPQHPFLDGNGNAPSSAVFAACILSAALKSQREDLVRAAEHYASSAQHTPNPFLYEFYVEQAEEDSVLPTEHVGLLFESVLAKTRPGETVRLNVEGDDSEGELSIELSIQREGGIPKRIDFKAPVLGTLKFGRRVSGVSVDAPSTSVEFGARDQMELVAPVFVSAKSIKLLCTQLVVKNDLQSMDNTVVLESDELISDPGLSAPIIRQGAQLQVSWPDSTIYPWTPFAGPALAAENPKTAEALRALRRLVIAFRSHSKGQLARFKGKIEHQRMLKGKVGEELLEKLISDRVITFEAPMYILNADALGLKVGASYVEVKLKNYSSQTRAYVQDIAQG